MQIAGLSRRAARLYGAGYRPVFAHAWSICSQRGFTPLEAYRLGLFDPKLDGGALSRFCSRRQMTRLQKAVNPADWAVLVKNKALFYRYCRAQDLPIPELYAVWCRDSAGWTHTGRPVVDRRQWVTFIEEDLPEHFVIKPAESAFGRGLSVFKRTPDGIVDAQGKPHSADDICESMGTVGRFDSFVIQERLWNHPDLLSLTDVQYLQTLRLNTLIDSDGRCRLIHGHMKFIAGSSAADNFDYGTTGNLQCLVDLDCGRLPPAVTMTQDPPAIVTVARHPKTKEEFAGFQLPLWEHACRLVLRAAPLFLPLRAIGWDIALTPAGPVLVEGIIWWDPPNQHENLDTIVTALSGAR